MMQTSEQIDQLATALAKAQSAMENPPKNREVVVSTRGGQTYKFKYTTLDTVIDTIRKPLTDNGIAFLQSLQTVDGKLRLATRVIHSSGQWLETETPVTVADEGMQALGSAQTYAKRYALSALFGLAADEDDDGNAGDGNTAKPTQTKAVQPAKPAPPVQPAPPKAAPPKAETPKASNPEQLAAEWVAKAKEDIADMATGDDVDRFLHDNSRWIASLGKYPEIDAEFTQFVRHAINSKPSNLEAA